jgi:hypothetical protein
MAVATVGYAANFFDSSVELGPCPTVIGAITVLWLASVLNFGGAKLGQPETTDRVKPASG